jgi:MATE family multidrug resistance protein
MEMADVPVYAALVGLILHVPFNLLFIYVFDWGYLGCAAATVMFQAIQPCLISYYLFRTRHGQWRVLESTGAVALGRTDLSSFTELRLAVSSLSGILQYLSLALPGVIIISEWWASEVSIFLSGRLSPNPDLALDGMTIYQSINTFCFMFPVGCSVAAAARVGYCLGQGDPKRAAFAAHVGLLCATVLSALMGSILYFTPHTLFPSFFSPDSSVVEEASKTIPLLATYVFADGVQNSLNGIIKGCGRQCITAPIVIVAYWVVGVPLAYYFAFARNDGIMCNDEFVCGIRGLVSGMTVGTWLHCLLLALVVYGTTRWDFEAERAKERLQVDKTPHQSVSPFAPDDDEVKSFEMITI